MSEIKCIDVLKGLNQIADNSQDVIIVDPPYCRDGAVDFGNNKDDMPLDQYIDWCKQWINECVRVMKDSASMFIYGFPETLCHLAVNMPIPFRILQWHYTNKTVPTLKFWQRSHESIICAYKDKNKRIFNDEVREPYLEAYTKLVGKPRKGTPGRYGKNGKETIYNVNESGAKLRDVIKVAALAGGAGMKERVFYCKDCARIDNDKDLHKDHEIIIHPTQKPLELCDRLIMSCKPKDGGKLLVPFVGSGSECIAGQRLGMEYLGFEINPDYILLASTLLQNEKKGIEFNKLLGDLF